ncbi:hypothetical protein [Streptomyces sp. NRRL B-24720]|uniref:hypothetical protein n=1 Tax=Streptomyces sp. NRRL B-24720 TaxID=1476876 RepID=UPI000564B505|nr:hypothetical protein [Streptomyces sp. NRRL B-24720]
MSTLPMSGIAATIETLRTLAARFPDLPAADVGVSRIYPDRLVLSFHRDLGEFEAWRSALDINPVTVSLDREIDGPLMWLIADTVIDNTTVQIMGYGQRQAPADGRLAGAAVAV